MTRLLPVVTVGHGLGWAGEVLAPLSAAGLDVHAVRDAQAAANVLMERPCSVCLVDAADQDAARTVAILRGRFGRAVVIGVVNGTDVDGTARTAVEGCHDVVGRPLSGSDLTAIVANAREMTTALEIAAHQSGDDGRPAELLGVSADAKRLNVLVQRAAETRGSVLIVAERGFSPAAVAREVHNRGRDARGPFVVVDCATADPVELERSLFGGRSNGHARESDDVETVGPGCGVMEACGGTLVLENLADMPASVQARLARIARDREVLIDGEVQTRPYDARLIGAAGPGLDRDAEEGRFRADLHRRLSVNRLVVPPLRERIEDIPLLVAHLARRLSEATGAPPVRLTSGAVTVLGALPWSGNLGELRALLSQLMSEAGGEIVGVEDVLRHVRFDGGTSRPMASGPLSVARARFEREYIEAVLQRHQGRMADAAKALGMQRPNLYRKARQLGLFRSRTS